MKKPRIGLVDYGMGNLKSVSKALETAGAAVRPVESPRDLRRLEGLVVPGVGAFGLAMKNLRKRKLIRPLREWIASDRPFLGICLGYQVLFERSEEGGSEKGLGVFRGKVRRFPRRPGLKVPHMGWNRVEWKKGGGDYFYFVHSYYPEPKEKKVVAATTRHGVSFASGIGRGNLLATQFHPEKSGRAGLALLRKFVRSV